MKPINLTTSLLFAFTGLILSAQLTLANPNFKVSESDLVGKWSSSRAKSIIEINADGTWLIQKWNQSGWWALNSNEFIWMYERIKIEDATDINPISSYTIDDFNIMNQFTLVEQDVSTTVFIRKD